MSLGGWREVLGDMHFSLCGDENRAGFFSSPSCPFSEDSFRCRVSAGGGEGRLYFPAHSSSSITSYLIFNSDQETMVGFHTTFLLNHHHFVSFIIITIIIIVMFPCFSSMWFIPGCNETVSLKRILYTQYATCDIFSSFHLLSFYAGVCGDFSLT